MKVDILGVKYDVKFINEADEVMDRTGAIGYTDCSSKRIVVLKCKATVTNYDIPEVCDQHTLRHEIIHAYLYESGIDFGQDFHNESMVDWLAMQFPKLEKTINNI